MHTTTMNIRGQLGMSEEEPLWEEAFVFDKLEGTKVNRGEVLFPRIEIEKELSELESLKAEEGNIPIELKEPIEYDVFDVTKMIGFVNFSCIVFNSKAKDFFYCGHNRIALSSISLDPEYCLN